MWIHKERHAPASKCSKCAGKINQVVHRFAWKRIGRCQLNHARIAQEIERTTVPSGAGIRNQKPRRSKGNQLLIELEGYLRLSAHVIEDTKAAAYAGLAVFEKAARQNRNAETKSFLSREMGEPVDAHPYLQGKPGQLVLPGTTVDCWPRMTSNVRPKVSDSGVLYS